LFFCSIQLIKGLEATTKHICSTLAEHFSLSIQAHKLGLRLGQTLKHPLLFFVQEPLRFLGRQPLIRQLLFFALKEQPLTLGRTPNITSHGTTSQNAV
jgi:hypothetical protein